MLDVHSLQNFEFMNNFLLVAGNAGLYKIVTNVVILDYEGIEEDYHGFHEGDFVITNLMFAKRHPERIYNSFKALIALGVSAFAIKTVIFTKLPDEVIALANEKQVPIFLFNDIFIEDVILNITDHLRSATNFNYNENLINEIISPSDHASQVDDLSKSLGIDGQADYCSAMYLGYKTPIDKFTLQRTINKLQIQIQHLAENYNLKLALYNNGILFMGIFSEEDLQFFISGSKGKEKISKSLEKYWLTLMSYLGLQTDSFHIGIADSLLSLDMLDLTIMRCLNSYSFCVTQNQPDLEVCEPMTYTKLNTQNIVYPLLQDKYMHEYLLEMVKKIQPKCSDFKAFKGTSAYLTLKACIQADFDMYKAADLLFQHQNTIRYRLKKLQSSLEIKDETSFRILASFLVKFADQY